MTADQAPRSSTRVRIKVIRELAITEVYDAYLDQMEVTTRVREMADGNHRAVTTVSRPCGGWPAASRDVYDSAVMKALRDLPGFAGGVTISMGRTYEVEWDGVRAPV